MAGLLADRVCAVPLTGAGRVCVVPLTCADRYVVTGFSRYRQKHSFWNFQAKADAYPMKFSGLGRCIAFGISGD